MRKVNITDEAKANLSEGQRILIDYLNKGGRVWGVEAIREDDEWSFKLEIRSSCRKCVSLTSKELTYLKRNDLIEIFCDVGLIGPL